MRYLTLLILLLISVNSNAQWQKVYEAPTNFYGFTANTNYIFSGTVPLGVFRSSNNGINWDSVNSGLINRSVRTITAQNNYIFAGTDSGLFRSTNNGNNWSSIHQNIYYIFVYHLVCNEQFVFAGTNKGLFRSSNHGVTWDSINTGLPYNFGRIYIDALSSYSETLYVGVGTGTYSIPRVYKSYNNGNNWIPIIYSGIDSSTIYSLEVKDSIVLCGTYKGVYISRNSGINWRRIPEINQNIGLFGLSILDNNNILISSFGYGVQVSTNGGANWVFKNEGLLPEDNNIRSLFTFNGNTYLGTRSTINLPSIYKRTNQQLIPVNELNIHLPKDNVLFQNYPNPFNPTTKIKFSVPSLSSQHGLDGDLIRLLVYDIQGREVQTLVNESLKPGMYEVTFDGSHLTSGVYFCKLQIGSFISVKRMVLLK